MTEQRSIFIGSKPFMNYVTGVVMQFSQHGASSVVIRARGKFITRAVDVAQVAVNRFLQGQVETDGIDIGSEEFLNEDGKRVRVSSIAITLSRTAPPASS